MFISNEYSRSVLNWYWIPKSIPTTLVVWYSERKCFSMDFPLFFLFCKIKRKYQIICGKPISVKWLEFPTILRNQAFISKTIYPRAFKTIPINFNEIFFLPADKADLFYCLFSLGSAKHLKIGYEKLYHENDMHKNVLSNKHIFVDWSQLIGTEFKNNWCHKMRP